jgi:hypothetical protein
MVGSNVLVLLLVGGLTVLTPLAHSSPPDPTWIAGIYDGDDFDDVIVSVTSVTSTVDAGPLAGLEPGQVVLGLVPSLEADSAARPAPPAPLGRAPPPD